MCMRGVSVKRLWDDTQDLQFVNLHTELVERLVSYHVLLCQQRIGCMETTLVVDLQGPNKTHYSWALAGILVWCAQSDYRITTSVRIPSLYLLLLHA